MPEIEWFNDPDDAVPIGAATSAGTSSMGPSNVRPKKNAFELLGKPASSSPVSFVQAGPISPALVLAMRNFFTSIVRAPYFHVFSLIADSHQARGRVELYCLRPDKLNSESVCE